MKIEQIDVGELSPYARNSRTHSPQQVAQIAASIQEFGFTNPVLIDERNEIIAGHGRLMAAQSLGLDKVPCLRLVGLSETQRRAYVIADNKLAMNAGWDMDLLKMEVSALAALDVNLALLGFGEDELGGLLAMADIAEPMCDEDEAPPVPTVPVSRIGDVWLCGRHRVMCGDSTDHADVSTLMVASKARLMQTDPPYGICYVENAKTKGQANHHIDIENDELDGEKLQAFLEDMIRAALPMLHDNCAFYLWHPMLTQGTFFAAAAAAAADILIHRQIIWQKPSMVFGRGDYHWQHELCFYGWRRGHRPEFYGPRNQTTLWPIGRETSKEHPTAKPVALWVAPIENHTRPGDVVYEPFSGSGSRIISAEQTGRLCYAMELSPAYVDVAVKRWQNFTGRSATLEGDGRTFAEIQRERIP